ncbi:MAG: glycosyltransferase family 4 protein [Planctomycetota bacterium]|jgi:glycosyltransferase involved in cell wall biosynthesis
MNFLVLTNNPTRASFRQRIGVYLDTLRDNGIRCEVAGYPSGSLARWKLLSRSRDFDAVFLHKKRLNPLDAYWLRRNSRKIIYDFDDAVMYNDKHPDRLSRKRQNAFERTVRLAHLVIAGNPYLAEHTGKFNQNVRILPTGLDVKSYVYDTNKPNDGKTRLVWIGSKSTLGYLASLKPALEEIGSRFDNVVLRIICDEFFDLQNMEVEKRRWSLESQAVDLVTSDIGLAPLPEDRFTRGKCGFKILQYAAGALPVVASPVGVNSEYIEDKGNGFLAAGSADWIEKISLLLKEPQLRKQMGEAGRAKVKAFDLRIIGAKFCGLVVECLESKS